VIEWAKIQRSILDSPSRSSRGNCEAEKNCTDIRSAPSSTNANPLGAMFHGVSVFYCMTTSLAKNGAGLGTLGFHEAKVRELCEKAGFSSVQRVPLENSFNNLYEAKP
jgi:hypothetical protein